MKESAITVKNLKKSYKGLNVLKGISFDIEKGSVLALLGPNGAGKTTTIRILSTLLLPDGGQAKINGFDLLKEPEKVKASIGLTGQFAAVDEYLTGFENLEMIGRLYRMNGAEIKKRADEILTQFDLQEDAKRIVKTYSGGMRRKLDLAMSLISSPPIIFLDEPTTGLDPRSRIAMWEMIKALVKDGTTILLTTQYMDEADQLADNVIVIDNGKVIAEGKPDSLKKKIGSDRLELLIPNKTHFEKASKSVRGQSLQIDYEKRSISFAVKSGVKDMREVLMTLERARIEVESASLHKPTLDDVFLTLTGHAATEENKPGKKGGND